MIIFVVVIVVFDSKKKKTKNHLLLTSSTLVLNTLCNHKGIIKASGFICPLPVALLNIKQIQASLTSKIIQRKQKKNKLNYLSELRSEERIYDTLHSTAKQKLCNVLTHMFLWEP